MSIVAAEIAIPTDIPERSVGWRSRWLGPGLVLPAVIITIAFSLIPLGYLLLISLTNKSDYMFGLREYSLDNYDLVFDRYRLNVVTTLRL